MELLVRTFAGPERGSPPPDEPPGPSGGGGFAGDRACVSCHSREARIQEAGRHARAIRSLARTGREVDPGCVPRHVVGYGRRTGFLSLEETPALARVGCESCHGPGGEHVRDPGRPLPDRARRACLRCHDEDHDPGFDFERKWPVIRHP